MERVKIVIAIIKRRISFTWFSAFVFTLPSYKLVNCLLYIHRFQDTSSFLLPYPEIIVQISFHFIIPVDLLSTMVNKEGYLKLKVASIWSVRALFSGIGGHVEIVYIFPSLSIAVT